MKTIVEVDLQIYVLGADYVPKNEVQVLWSRLSLVHVSSLYIEVVEN